MEQVPEGKKEAENMPTRSDSLNATDVSEFKIADLLSVGNRSESMLAEREHYSLWNMQENVQSFMPDLKSGCIFSPEYAEIQRRLRKNDG